MVVATEQHDFVFGEFLLPGFLCVVSHSRVALAPGGISLHQARVEAEDLETGLARPLDQGQQLAAPTPIGPRPRIEVWYRCCGAREPPAEILLLEAWCFHAEAAIAAFIQYREQTGDDARDFLRPMDFAKEERISTISKRSDLRENFCRQRIIFDSWKHGML